MKYENDIIDILLEAGERGLSVKKIAHHVCNKRTTLFESLEEKDVRAAISQWLWQKSRQRNSCVEHTGKWGTYRLKEAAANTDLQLNFLTDEDLQFDI